jgi:hypothetical protein
MIEGGFLAAALEGRGIGERRGRGGGRRGRGGRGGELGVAFLESRGRFIHQVAEPGEFVAVGGEAVYGPPVLGGLAGGFVQGILGLLLLFLGLGELDSQAVDVPFGLVDTGLEGGLRLLKDVPFGGGPGPQVG